VGRLRVRERGLFCLPPPLNTKNLDHVPRECKRRALFFENRNPFAATVHGDGLCSGGGVSGRRSSAEGPSALGPVGTCGRGAAVIPVSSDRGSNQSVPSAPGFPSAGA